MSIQYLKGCESYRKSIKRDQIEDDFLQLIEKIVPSQDTVDITSKLFEQLWNDDMQHKKARKQSLKAGINTIDKKLDQLDRIVETDSGSLITSYEKKIKLLEEEKLLLDEKWQAEGQIKRSFDETVRTLMQFLSKPLVLWVSGALEDKRAFFKLSFEEHLVY